MLHFDRLAQARAGDAQGVQGHVTFVETGNEFCSHPGSNDPADNHQGDGGQSRGGAKPEVKLQRWKIDRLGGAHDDVLLLGNFSREEQRHCGEVSKPGRHNSLELNKRWDKNRHAEEYKSA